MEKIKVHVKLNDNATLEHYNTITEYMEKHTFSKETSNDDVLYGNTYFTNDVIYDTKRALTIAKDATKNISILHRINFEITVTQNGAEPITVTNILL